MPSLANPCLSIPAVPIEERWVDFPDGRMRYLKAGRGPALVLVHGLMGYSFSWRFTMPALAPYATVYAIDNLGAGLSPARPDMDCGVRATAKRVLQFVEAMGVQEFDLLGTSHGGGVATVAASICAGHKDDLGTEAKLQISKRSPLLRKLILVAPVNPWSAHGKILAPFLGGRIGALLVRTTLERSRSWDVLWLRRLFGDITKIPPDSLEGYRKPVYANHAFRHARNILSTWTRDLAEIDRALPTIREYPTLLIWGTQDKAVEFRSAEILRRNFVNVRLAAFEGVGHLPYEEAPNDFNRTLIDFLQS
jgi:pimeloyl-ACP methyl ester carboxylesterase